MKKVHTPDNVAHLWANQHQDEARNSANNFYFYGNEIYSYGSHFCIAKHIEGGVILFTERSYSSTTLKHISIVRNACSHKDIVFCHNPKGSHSENFGAWKNECTLIIDKLSKARKPERYIQELEGVKYRAEKYAKLFNITVPEDLALLWVITSKEEVVTYMEAKAEAILKHKEAEQKRLKKEHRVNVKKFREFKTPRIHTRLGYDLLRHNPINDCFQTSQGVEIPLAIGLGIYQRLINRQAVEKVLDYDVINITPKYIQVGCHKVEMKEIIKVVSQVNQ